MPHTNRLVAWSNRRTSHQPAVHLVDNRDATTMLCGRRFDPATWAFAQASSKTDLPLCKKCFHIWTFRTARSDREPLPNPQSAFRNQEIRP